MSEVLAKLGHPPLFISKIGNDLFGREIVETSIGVKMNVNGISTSDTNTTAIYSALLNKHGECVFGLGDMSIHAEIAPGDVEKHIEFIKRAPIVIIDGNIPIETITKALEICDQYSISVWFEPTEVRKAEKLLHILEHWKEAAKELKSVRYISPNIRELMTIAGVKNKPVNFDIETGAETGNKTSKIKYQHVLDEKSAKQDNDASRTDEISLSSIISRCFSQFSGLEVILLTRGSKGIFLIQRESDGFSVLHVLAPAIRPEEIKSVSGAGDCFNGGFISGLICNLPLEECAQLGTLCAKKSLESTFNVPPTFDI